MQVDFLVGAGFKPTSIVSYNHLGNNDGMNLSAPQTFRSKEISKSNVVDDVVASNSILYGPGKCLFCFAALHASAWPCKAGQDMQMQMPMHPARVLLPS